MIMIAGAKSAIAKFEIASRADEMFPVIDVTKFNSLRGRVGGETYIKLRLKAHITRDVTLPHLGNGRDQST